MGTCNISSRFKRVRMTGFEIYVFLLCFIVFSLLTAMFTYLIVTVAKMELDMIRYGHRDEAIKKQKEKELKKNKNLSRALLWANRIFSVSLCLLMVTAFAFAIYVRAAEDRPANGIPSIKVVKSESMATKNKKNTYLFTNDLNDQFQMFDIIVGRHMPAEEDIELYDIVIYERDGVYVIHRIVGIEEPNASHPNERHFLLQGDAVDSPDTFPVLYSQMKGIYEGTRIPFVGSFVLFLQSPAGWLCVLLVVFSMVAIPIVDRKIKIETDKRLLPPVEEKPKEAKES